MHTSRPPKIPEVVKKLDRSLVLAAKNVKILSVLTWPPNIRIEFLASWERGDPHLPQVEYAKSNLKSERNMLQQIAKQAPKQHPLGRYIARTARSYVTAVEMLDQIGEHGFCANSLTIYGHPLDSILGGKESHYTAAERFISKTNSFTDSCKIDVAEVCIMPETVRAALQERADLVFGPGIVSVKLDASLSSKAAAGAENVRIRTSTCFSEEDIDQLAEHEVLVHSLTALNGRKQPILQSLSLASPRTTRAQEGLALFAELITYSMDLQRLRRIALRVLAIKLALEGADFLELFKFFLEHGQSEVESFQSAARIFRGGDVRGKIVFTKDLSYLAGLAEVHTFLRKAIQEEKLLYPHYLFAGRLTLGDVLEFEELFEDGAIALPHYEPEWITQRPRIAAFLLYSGFLNTIDLEGVDLISFANSAII